MDQKHLFEDDDQARWLAHRTDPETSHEAARDIVEHLARMQKRACEIVALFPGHTAQEMAQLARLRDIRTLNRRLCELERKGLIVRQRARVCSVTGRRAHVWYPVETSEHKP